MDWGLARNLAASTNEAPAPVSLRALCETHAGAVMGTPLYMSPEQARGAHDQIDLYALTVIFHGFLFLER